MLDEEAASIAFVEEGLSKRIPQSTKGPVMEEKSRISDSARFGRQMVERVEETASNIRQKAGEAMDTAHNAASSAKQMAQDGMSQLQDTAADCYRQGRSRAEAVWKTLEEEVQQRPFRAVLIAAGCGLLVGALFTRRR